MLRPGPRSDTRPAAINVNRFVFITMNLSATLHPASDTRTPSPDEIAQCAREIWTESGQPQGRDDVIWLEAERRLIAARRAAPPAAESTSSASRQRPRPAARPPSAPASPRPARTHP